MKPTPMTDDQIQSIAKAAVSDALDFMESEIAEDRIKAQRYFNGEVDLGHEEGRSKVVATKVRDTIRAIKPSLLRVFLSNDKYVQFVGSNAQEMMQAQTATQYIHSVFTKKHGYRVLYSATHDALLKKTGIVKAYWDEYDTGKVYDLTGLTEGEYMMLAQEDDVEIIEQSVEMSMQVDQFGMQVETPSYDVKLIRTKREGKLCVEPVPPEEFFVDRSSKSIDDFFVCGHRTEMRVGDLVAMGYDFEEVSTLTGISEHDTLSDAEDFERRGYEQEDEEEVLDPSMRKVAVTECYMRIDVDGTGIPMMHKILLGGGQYKLLDYEVCDTVPFAVFEVDPEPHTFHGRSLAEIIIDDQDASTSILRGVLDNIAATNNPRLAAVDGRVNIDDLLNNEIGAIVRMDEPNMVTPLTVPFAAGQVLQAAEYYDQIIETKTGVSRASAGLDPDALQNTTATAARITQSAAAGQIEVIARNLAEGGMARLFQLMLKLVAENSPDEQMMLLSGDQFAPIDPRSWNTEMSIEVNVGLGTGKEDEKAAALMQTLQTQMQVWSGYGPGNGLVGMTNIRNTLADILALGGFRNADRYYMPMNPQIEQQLVMQAQQKAAQQQQGQQDQQAQALVQAETIRAQTKAQSDMAKIQLDAQKALAADDRERDKMDQELILKAAEIIGKYGTAVDVERIKAMQSDPRFADAIPSEAVQQARF